MVNYLLVRITGVKVVALLDTTHRLGRTKFVFTVRTQVRTGGCNMNM